MAAGAAAAAHDINDNLQSALKVLQQQPWDRKKRAMALLLQLLRKISNSPEKAAYQRLNEFNKTLSTELFSVPGCLDFLHAVGFQNIGTSLVLHHKNGNVVTRLGDESELTGDHPTCLTVSAAADVVEEFNKAETNRQLRLERDERIAKAKAEDSNKAVLKCQASRFMQEEEQARRKKLAAATMTVTLQSLATTANVIIPVDATVGFLRARAAEMGRHYAHQVRLVDCSTGRMLRFDDEKLRDCGVHDNSQIAFSIGMADEMEAANVQLALRFGRIGSNATLDKDSWAYTRECLECAIQAGLPSEKVQAYKRSLRNEEISLQEIRNLIAQDLQEIGHGEALNEVRNRFLFHERIEQKLTQLQTDRAYSLQLAADNAQGLKEASHNASHAYSRRGS